MKSADGPCSCDLLAYMLFVFQAEWAEYWTHFVPEEILGESSKDFVMFMGNANNIPKLIHLETNLHSILCL